MTASGGNGCVGDDTTPVPGSPRTWGERVAHSERVLGGRIPRTDEAIRVLLAEQATLVHSVEVLSALQVEQGEDMRTLGRRHRDLQDLAGRVLTGVEDIVARDDRRDEQLGAIAAELSATRAAVASLAGAVGVPGDPAALARASSHDLTAEQIDSAELGTGLHRQVAELRVVDGRQDRRLSALSEAGRGAARGAGAAGGAAGALGLVWVLLEALGGPAVVGRVLRGLIGS
jgi:hypothetical protein